MHRSIETVDRPEPHVFVLSPEDVCGASVTLSHSGRSGICRLPKTNSVHVPAGEVYQPTSEDDRSKEIVGDAGDR